MEALTYPRFAALYEDNKKTYLLRLEQYGAWAHREHLITAWKTNLPPEQYESHLLNTLKSYKTHYDYAVCLLKMNDLKVSDSPETAGIEVRADEYT
jgi:homogentisate 1,2-dioxygenase